MRVGSVPDGKTIYHYCPPKAFYEIMHSKCIWLSASNNTNDYSETRWAERFFNEAIEQFDTDSTRQKLEKLQDFFHLNSPLAHIASFSEEGDLLSQWRAYADNAHGVSIGFNLDYFEFKRAMPFMAETVDLTLGATNVSYDIQELREQLNEVVRQYLAIEADDGNGLITAALYLRYLCQTSKNPAFAEEREYRIIHTPLIASDHGGGIAIFGNCSERKFRIVGNKLTSYFELDFSTIKKLCPIDKIILGPKNQFSNYDIQNFLASLNLGNIEIVRSNATYR